MSPSKIFSEKMGRWTRETLEALQGKIHHAIASRRLSEGHAQPLRDGTPEVESGELRV